MYMTQEDLHAHYHQVHQNVANKLGIEDFEWKSTNELADEIKNANPQVASKVEKFIEAYESWFNVHEEIESSGNTGNLTDEQHNKLMDAIKDRDSTRTDLIDELKKL